MRYGMVKALGDVAYEEERSPFLGGMQVPGPREFSEQTAREIDCAVRELVTGAFDKALAILSKYRAQLDEGAKLLLEKETLTREQMPVLRDLPLAAASGTRVRDWAATAAPAVPAEAGTADPAAPHRSLLAGARNAQH
jgi:cell division protease FtsH